MALCLPRKRRATSLASRPRPLAVASITNHSCVTSAGLALNVLVMSFSLEKRVWRALFHGRRSSGGNLLGGFEVFAAGLQKRCEARDYMKKRPNGQFPGFGPVSALDADQLQGFVRCAGIAAPVFAFEP